MKRKKKTDRPDVLFIPTNMVGKAKNKNVAKSSIERDTQNFIIHQSFVEE